MKKFISFVMAATMVASLVPATAFAASGGFTATARVSNAQTVAKGVVLMDETAELQLRVTDTMHITEDEGKMKLNLTLDNANWNFADTENFASGVTISAKNADGSSLPDVKLDDADGVTNYEEGDDFATLNLVGCETLTVDSIITIALSPATTVSDKDGIVLNKTTAGTKATVSVDSKAVVADDLVFATVESAGLKASIRKTVDVAVEEVAELYSGGITIEPLVGDFATNTEITLKVSKGFEFKDNLTQYTVGVADSGTADVTGNATTAGVAALVTVDESEDDMITFTIEGAHGTPATAVNKIVIKKLQVDAVSAKEGDVATIKVAQKNANSVTLEVAKVIGYGVVVSVDEDEDVPVMFSGVDAVNAGLTAGEDDHQSLKVTLEETYPGAWNFKKGFTMSLPEGVYVTDVEADSEYITSDGTGAITTQAAWDVILQKAYKDGGYETFEVARRFAEEDTVNDTKKAKLDLEFTLVADPNFSGDVVLTVEGESIDKQEVTIANFVPAYTVKAEQNDMIIDYRNTAIPTKVVVTEGAAGLWSKNSPAATIGLVVERMDFEGDPTFTVDDKSELELKNAGVTSNNNNNNVNGDGIAFTVKAESYDEVAEVTISEMELYMGRSLAAGAYDLKLNGCVSYVNSGGVVYGGDTLYAKYLAQSLYAATPGDLKDTVIVNNETDFNGVVKEAFINVVTAGRDQDDASFTTKVVVPVGESYLLSGETKVELDAPAYVNAAGYTMLPVRAVAKALGVNNNNVLWNAEARTVTIMYGQRIITMTVGQKVVYVNGSALPATAAVEISKDRTFLGMRDLSTALGVTDITWDAATKTATMNGSK